MGIVLKIIAWTLGVVLVLVIAFSAWFFWMTRRSFPQTAGTVDVPGLSAPVSVVRDEYGIPNIYADTTRDLFFAQGYVHAQDRFWQMDFNRHVTAGRISELVGESQLDTDKYLRTMGWRRVAEQEWAMADGVAREVLQAYADGVNAYIADRSPTQLGLEYLMLRLTGGNRTVEPWTPVDTLAWAKAIAWDLRGNAEDELRRVRYVQAVGGPRAAQLYPEYPFEEHPVIVGQGSVVDGEFDQATEPASARRGAGCAGDPCPDPAEAARIAVAEAAQAGTGRGTVQGSGLSSLARLTSDALADVAPSLEGLERIEATLASLIGPVGPGVGSNSWAVAGSESASGTALLANDPHLGPAMPSVWYQVGLHCTTVGDACPFDLTGMSFPGVPAVLSGHNQRAGWAVTNLGPDVTDLVLEQIDDEGYYVDGQRKPFTVIEDVIKVAGGDDVPITIRATEHGPLMSDVGSTEQEVAQDAPAAQVEPAAGREFGVAYRWTALQPGRLVDAVLGLATMEDFADFREAARNWYVPAQNLVYADVDGNIGYQTPGDIPIRSGYSGRFPVPGWDSSYGWTGFIPFEALPSVYNPESGFIVTANNAAVGRQYPFLLTDDWDYGYRADRITDLLEEATAGASTIDAARMAEIQLDTFNANAATMVPRMAGTVGGQLEGQAARAFALLEDWDFTDGRDSAAAAYFAAFWRHLQEPLYNDELPPDARSSGTDRWWLVTDRLWDAPDDPWWDDIRTPQREARDDTVRAALDAAAGELTDRFGADTADWSWGEMHTLTVVANPFGASGIAPLEWIFNRGPVELPGAGELVNAIAWDASVTCDPALDETDDDDADSGDPACAGAPAVQPAYEVSWVPSFRSVTDFADLDSAVWVHLTGASGHAFHPHYYDQLGPWAEGRTLPWVFTRDAVQARAVDTLTLQPTG